ncbi:MAG: bifunctional orotidine-5'-phosphate decarboxylase/orotate phosphoribosyltransferase [Microcystaceae cyanobacterium]
MSFFEKLHDAIALNNTLLVIALDPNPEMLPSGDLDSNNLSDNLIVTLEHWLNQIIEQTADHVCAYKPSLGFYQALGSEGIALFQRILTKIPSSLPIILDAKLGDLNTSSLWAKTAFETWQVDAITLNPYAGQDHCAPFLVYPDKGVFILCHTSNPGAIALQHFPNDENPFYLQVIKEAQTWGTPEQVYLEIGTRDLTILQKIRQISPERTLLLRSIWGQDNRLENIEDLLKIGLTTVGDGLLVPVPQDYFKDPQFAERVINLKQTINQIRHQVTQINSSCELWQPDIPLSHKHPHQELILQLFDMGCLLFGEYVQASGLTFSYYIDLRKIISNPQVFHQVLQAYAEILQTLTFDRIAGIPYGSLPTATGLSLLLHHPMIYPRKEVKAHGTRRVIEGNYEPGETIVVVDDILISGKSAIEGAEKIQSAGLVVQDIVVFIDHESGVKDKLTAKGYQAYSVLTISEITETLYEAGRIDETQYRTLSHQTSSKVD